MHILHVYKNYWPIVGGIENHIKVLAESQAADGHQVTVLVVSERLRPARKEMNGVQVIKASRLMSLASTPLSLGLPWQLARLQPDVTHLHFPYPLGEVSQWLLGHSRATVLTYHSDIIRQKQLLRFYTPLMHRALRRVDRIIATTERYAETSTVLTQYKAKLSVVPFGIDQSRFRASPRSSLLAKSDMPVVLFVGVLRYYKGVQYLIRAMKTVQAFLVIVGDGPQREELETLVDELSLRERVHFAGRVSDPELPSYYAGADLFCLPACERSEAFGIVLLEALASGLPIVNTEIGTGTSYVNQDGVTGIVVPPGDPAALANAIQRLLGDDALRARFAQEALKRARQFTVPLMVNAVYRVYELALGSVSCPEA